MLKKNKNSKLKKWIEFWCVCAIIGLSLIHIQMCIRDRLKAVNQSLKSELGTAKSALLDYKVAELPTDTENAVLFECCICINTAFKQYCIFRISRKLCNLSLIHIQMCIRDSSNIIPTLHFNYMKSRQYLQYTNISAKHADISVSYTHLPC